MRSVQGLKNGFGKYIEIFVLFAFLGVIACVFVLGRKFLTIDACLDDGGSFDYEQCSCDYENSHSTGSVLWCLFP